MSILNLYQEMRTIYGFCPCCDDPFRLSDVELFIRSRPALTEFDRLDSEWEKLDRQIEKFEERESAIRTIAKELGRKAAQKKVRSIAPFLQKQKIEPADVKVIFNPVEYVVFRDLKDRECTGVDFVDHPSESIPHERTIKSIDHVLRAGNIEWHTYRVTDEGLVVHEK